MAFLTYNVLTQRRAAKYLSMELRDCEVQRLTAEEAAALDTAVREAEQAAARAVLLINTARERFECLRCATDAGETHRPGTRDIDGNLITTFHHRCDLRAAAE